MTLPLPNLDDRTWEDIVDEAMRLIPQYCPTWTNFNPSDPGITLVELFAWMTEMLLYRLNKIPEKVYVTLLDLIGIRPQPARPATTMQTFYLERNVPKGVVVPERTQVTTEQADGEEPIIFETTGPLFVTNTQLVTCYSMDRARVENNTRVIERPQAGIFDVFAGRTQIERVIYLGDQRFKQLCKAATIHLIFDIPKPHPEEELMQILEWEYWNGRRWRELMTVHVPPEEIQGAEGKQGVSFRGPLEDLPDLVFIDGKFVDPAEFGEEEIPKMGQDGNAVHVNAWIRGRLMEIPLRDDLTHIDTIEATAMILEDGIPPDACVTQMGDFFVTRDVTKPFLPFDERPAYDYVWYVASEEGFSPEDAQIRIEVTLTDVTSLGGPNPTDDMALRWEYWNGQRWAEIATTTPEGVRQPVQFNFDDTTRCFIRNGFVTFLRPHDFQRTVVAGDENYWFRCRVEDGNYGKPGSYSEIDGEWVWVDEHPLRPPVIKELAVKYSQVPFAIDNCLGLNDSRFRDHTGLVRTEHRPFEPFKPFREETPAVFLGFDTAPPAERIALYFRLIEEEEDNDFIMHEPLKEEGMLDLQGRRVKPDQRIVWEFWNGRLWSELPVRDGTKNFTDSGVVSFVGPEDFRQKREFGQELYWVRARFELGSYSRSPRCLDVRLNCVEVVNAKTIKNEPIGSSDGTPDQEFAFQQYPVLAGQKIRVREYEYPSPRDERTIKQEEGEDALLEVRDDEGVVRQLWVRWHEVESFYKSGPTSRHYVMDPLTGRIRFGDGRRGMVPGAGEGTLVAEVYQTGGGSLGNVGAESLVEMLEDVEFIDRGTNHYPAEGGEDKETVEDAKLRAPLVIRNRFRAVTADDYEWLSLKATTHVARAKCIRDPHWLGRLKVLILPRDEEGAQDLARKPVAAPELIRRVYEFLNRRRLITTQFKVAKPRFAEISIRLTVVVQPGVALQKMTRAAENNVREFLHPLLGGTDGRGWPFGRTVHKSDLFPIIESMEGVDYIEKLELYDEDRRTSCEQVALRPDELVFIVKVEVKTRAAQRMMALE